LAFFLSHGTRCQAYHCGGGAAGLAVTARQYVQQCRMGQERDGVGLKVSVRVQGGKVCRLLRQIT